MAEHIVIGIDPGYDRVGWTVASTSSIKQKKIVDWGCIQTSSKDEIFVRYQHILASLKKIIKKYHPSQAAIETLFFSSNKKTALRVSEARGIIISVLLQSNIAIFEYNPLQIKQVITGHGGADKSAVEKMVRLQLQLPVTKQLDDVLDACGIMLTHMIVSRTSILRK